MLTSKQKAEMVAHLTALYNSDSDYSEIIKKFIDSLPFSDDITDIKRVTVDTNCESGTTYYRARLFKGKDQIIMFDFDTFRATHDFINLLVSDHNYVY